MTRYRLTPVEAAIIAFAENTTVFLDPEQPDDAAALLEAESLVEAEETFQDALRLALEHARLHGLTAGHGSPALPPPPQPAVPPPEPPCGIGGHRDLWLARDHIWRCGRCATPSWPSEVVARAETGP
jgi:hypothetical protein